MMQKSLTVFILVVLLAVAAILISSASRLAHAQNQYHAAQSSFDVVANDAQRVLELRNREQRVAQHKRPPRDLLDRVNAALSAAKLSATHFSGLHPESDASIPNASHGRLEYRSQTIRINLQRLTIRELGTFLAEWKRAQSLWTPTRIDLTARREPVIHRTGNSSGGGGLYDVNLLISALYLAER